MKGLGGMLVLAALVVGGYFMWTNMGGEFSGSAPAVERPNVELPDANDVGDKATDLGNRAADSVMGLSANTWRVIIISGLAAYVAWLWFTRPKFKWGIIGGGIMLIVMIAVVPQLR